MTARPGSSGCPWTGASTRPRLHLRRGARESRHRATPQPTPMPTTSPTSPGFIPTQLPATVCLIIAGSGTGSCQHPQSTGLPDGCSCGTPNAARRQTASRLIAGAELEELDQNLERKGKKMYVRVSVCVCVCDCSNFLAKQIQIQHVLFNQGINILLSLFRKSVYTLSS